MWSFIAQDLIHPPFFYALLKLWIGIGGDGVLWLRLLPLTLAVLALFPFISLCRELKLSRWTVVIGIGFLAFNGALIKHAQTVRMYSLLMLLALMSIWLFARYFNRGKSWVWLVIVNVLLVYTHYYGWLVVGGEFFTILLFQRIKIGRAAVMVGITIVSFFPWLIAIFNRDQFGSDLNQNIAWQVRPGVREVLRYFLALVEPFYSPASTLDPGSLRFIALPLLLILGVAIALYFSGNESDQRKTLLRFGIGFFAFPVVTAFLLSWILPNSIWGGRHLIIAAPMFMIIAAEAIASLKDRRVMIGALALIAALTLTAFVLEVRQPSAEQVWCGWDEIGNEIRAAESKTERPKTIYTFEQLMAYHLWFSGRKDTDAQVKIIKDVPVRTLDNAFFLPRGFDGVGSAKIDEISDPRIWVMFRVFSLAEESPILEAFTKRGYLVCNLYQRSYGTNRMIWANFAKADVGCVR